MSSPMLKTKKTLSGVFIEYPLRKFQAQQSTLNKLEFHIFHLYVTGKIIKQTRELLDNTKVKYPHGLGI